jgi:PTH1 family peptidyl-tRNA hydrolase
MLLWTGLGNPEPGMARQRHNIGFMAIDRIAQRHGFSPWRQRFKGLVAEGTIGGERILALKPMTYMNLSGDSVQPAAAFYRLAPADITVFHDELDLAPFKVKVKRGGGTAGHNGLRSTEAHIGNPFRRVRIGIGHPGHRDRVTTHVLGNFARAEEPALADMLGDIAALAPMLAEGDDARFMSELALRQQAAR